VEDRVSNERVSHRTIFNGLDRDEPEKKDD
jgi:hypothetical protein